jgi:serine/threonine protein phosphatase 1
MRSPMPQRPSASAPKTAPSTRIYAIGDIHGRLDLLKQLHEKILLDVVGCRAKRKLLIYMGDYIDRGMQSREVLDYLIHQKLGKFQSIFLRGNHEFAMRSFMQNPKHASEWLNWGGDATLFSYKINLFDEAKRRKSPKQLADELNEAAPQAHVKFLESLLNYHIEGDYLFVHAGVRPGISLEQQTLKDMLMIRDDFIQGGSLSPIGKTVVFGHTIFNQPFLGPQRIGIDTGAYYSGKLTALVLEGTKQSFITTTA